MSASPSPEHEVIEVETPPNSPSAALSFASPVSVTDEWQDKVNSPSKRQRVHSVRGQSAKRGKRNGRHPRHDATEVSPEPVLQHDQSNARVTTNDGRGPEAIEDLIDLDAHGEYQGSISYEEYVIAVVEGRAGFQAIRRSLFAVQGWDDRRQCTTVSIEARVISVMLIVQRLVGFTCNIRSSELKSMRHVFAPKAKLRVAYIHSILNVIGMG